LNYARNAAIVRGVVWNELGLRLNSMTLAEDTASELLRGIRHPNPAVRLKSAKGLAKLAHPSPEAFPILLGATDDPERGVREASVQALGIYGQEVLPTLTKLLAHPDKYVRRNAVWAIGKFGPAARFSQAALCNALNDADPRTSAGAAQALGSMGHVAGSAVPALVEAMRGTNVVLCRLASKALSQIGAPALDSLVENLRHADPFVRAEAALALGWMGPAAQEAASELVQLVEAYRPKVLPRQPVPNYADHSGMVTPSAPPSTNPQSSIETARLNGIQALGRIGSGAAAALAMLKEIEGFEGEPFRAMAALAILEIESEGQ